MNRLQKNYILCKTLHEQAQAQVEAWMRPYGYLLEKGDDASIEKFCEFEAQVEERCFIRPRREALFAAENDLLDWAQATMKRLYPQHAETIDLTLGQGRKFLNHRDKLLDTAVRLAV